MFLWGSRGTIAKMLNLRFCASKSIQVISQCNDICLIKVTSLKTLWCKF